VWFFVAIWGSTTTLVKQKTLVPLRNKNFQMVYFYPYPGYTKKGGLLLVFVTSYTAIYAEILPTGSQLPQKAETWVVAIKILP